MRTTVAVVNEKGDDFSLEEVELEGPREDEVLVRIVATGICHTDIHLKDSLPDGMFPRVFGHEGAGVVEAVGSGVAGISVGDHVVLSFDSCGSCTNCRTGHPAYCETFLPRNLSGRNVDGSSPATDTAGKPVGARWFGQSSFATYSIATPRNAV